MKSFSILFITLLLMVAGAQELSAQDYIIGRFYEGYIITLDGERQDGYIKYEKFNTMQSSIIFATDPKNRRTRTAYKAKALSGFMVAGHTWHSIPFKDLIGPKQQKFMQLDLDGQIKLYLFYGTESNVSADAQVVIRKGDEVAFNQGTFITGFHKKASELVSEHTALADKIRNKEKGYKLLQLYDIIDEYNAWYRENN